MEEVTSLWIIPAQKFKTGQEQVVHTEAVEACSADGARGCVLISDAG